MWSWPCSCQTILCLLGDLLMCLGTTLFWRWYLIRFSPGRYNLMLTTWSLLCSWRHFSASGKLGIPCLIGGWGSCCVWDWGASYKIWYPLSEIFVFTMSPLWVSWSTRMASCERGMIPRWNLLRICLGGSSVSYRCGTLVWSARPYGSWWEFPLTYNNVFLVI